RHPEPDRAGGHLPAAGGAARPLPVQGRDRLPHARAGARHRPPARGPPRPAMPRVSEFGLTPVADLAAIRDARATVAALRLSDPVLEYIVGLVRATRAHASLMCGASPRAGSMLAAAARARAALDGRDFVIPDDV